MGLGRRLLRLARANLNALLEVVAEEIPKHASIDRLSDDDLEAELSRRRLRRERMQTEREVRERAERAAQERLGARPSTRRRRWRSVQVPAHDPRLARYYARLEVPYGSDLEIVKLAYRRLMRDAHPDRHARDPERQRAATSLAQGLSEAYAELEKALS